MITIITLIVLITFNSLLLIPVGPTVLGDSYTDISAISDRNVIITTPARGVESDPYTATITIEKPECDYDFMIPYIQTSSEFYASADANSDSIPRDGGILFIIENGDSFKDAIFDTSYPYEANFENLPKDEYTLYTYIADRDQKPVKGENNYDTAKRIGIGDIYIAIGDSVTEGIDGSSWTRFPIQDWTEAPVRSANSRNFPICGITSTTNMITQQNQGEHIELNDHLNTFFNYPVFIMNEGVGRSTTESYLEIMQTDAWRNRVGGLEPNKFLIHLGINDVYGNNQSAHNIQLIIDNLKQEYHAEEDSIYLAIPAAGNNWERYIEEVRENNELPYGPDFKELFTNQDLVLLYGVHPDAKGYTQMAKLWFESIRNSELQ